MKILDFGLAKLQSSFGSVRTDSNLLMGTPVTCRRSSVAAVGTPPIARTSMPWAPSCSSFGRTTALCFQRAGRVHRDAHVLRRPDAAQPDAGGSGGAWRTDRLDAGKRSGASSIDVAGRPVLRELERPWAISHRSSSACVTSRRRACPSRRAHRLPRRASMATARRWRIRWARPCRPWPSGDRLADRSVNDRQSATDWLTDRRTIASR